MLSSLLFATCIDFDMYACFIAEQVYYDGKLCLYDECLVVGWKRYFGCYTTLPFSFIVSTTCGQAVVDRFIR